MFILIETRSYLSHDDYSLVGTYDTYEKAEHVMSRLYKKESAQKEYDGGDRDDFAAFVFSAGSALTHNIRWVIFDSENPLVFVFS